LREIAAEIDAPRKNKKARPEGFAFFVCGPLAAHTLERFDAALRASPARTKEKGFHFWKPFSFSY
jgi:hypothetical protein